jgi:hypothetical protein
MKIDVRSVHGTRSTTNLEYHNIEEIDYERHEKGLICNCCWWKSFIKRNYIEGLSVSLLFKNYPNV